MITLFRSDYASAGATLKTEKARLTLHIYITRYSDEKVDKWRGYAEASIEDDKSRHLVKKRVVYDAATGISGFELYRTLMQVGPRHLHRSSRHAYNIIQEE